MALVDLRAAPRRATPGTLFCHADWVRSRFSKREYRIDEPRDQATDLAVKIVVDVLESLSRDEHLDTADEQDVLAQERPVFATQADVKPDEGIDVSLEQELSAARWSCQTRPGCNC